MGGDDPGLSRRRCDSGLKTRSSRLSSCWILVFGVIPTVKSPWKTPSFYKPEVGLCRSQCLILGPHFCSPFSSNKS